MVLLSLYLAVYPAAAVGLAWRWGRRDPLRAALLFAAAWIVTEWLRATLFTGFAWNPLGAVTLPIADTARLATLIGTFGLSGLVVLAAGGLVLAARRRWRSGLALLLAAPLAALLLVQLPAGRTPLPASASPLMRIVQPDVGQQEKDQPGYAAENFRRLATLTGPPTRAPRLILWPEAAVPDYLEEQPWARVRLARLLGPGDFLLTGGVALEWGATARRSPRATACSRWTPPAACSTATTRRISSPMANICRCARSCRRSGCRGWSRATSISGRDRGRKATPCRLRQRRRADLLRDRLSRPCRRCAHRPAMLFNPSNDAWFGRWGPPQHLAQARLRAIEEGLSVVRSTPTGISAVIAPEGRLLAQLPWRSAGAIDWRFPAPTPPTLFARFGNLLSFLFAAALVVVAIALARRGR